LRGKRPWRLARRADDLSIQGLVDASAQSAGDLSKGLTDMKCSTGRRRWLCLETLEDRLAPAALIESVETLPPTAAFAASSESIDETAGTFSVTVNLSAASQATVSVPFTIGGNAAAGTDYSGVTASPLTFAPGQTSQAITGTLIDDHVPDDANQTIAFTLGAPTGATLGAVTANSLTIAEPAGFAYDARTQTLTVSGTNVNFTQATTADANGLHTTYAVTSDGHTEDYTDAAVAKIVVNATNGGHGMAILVTSDTYTGTDGQTHETREIARLGPGGGALFKFDASNNPYVFLQLNNFGTSYAYVGRADTGELRGVSVASDPPTNIFVTAGSYSYLFSPGEFHLISGSPSIYGYASLANDVAFHYDTAAVDAFVSSSHFYSYMSGTDHGQTFFNEAVGFNANIAIARFGQSVAYMLDSPAADTFVAYPTYTYTQGPDQFDPFGNNIGPPYGAVAIGFALVNNESLDGNDVAYDNDTSHHNVFSGFTTVIRSS
jgi:hypothetical protein